MCFGCLSRFCCFPSSFPFQDSSLCGPSNLPNHRGRILCAEQATHLPPASLNLIMYSFSQLLCLAFEGSEATPASWLHELPEFHTHRGLPWSWRLWPHAQGTRHYRSKAGTFAGTSFPAASVPRWSSLGTQSGSGSRDVTPAGVQRDTGTEQHVGVFPRKLMDSQWHKQIFLIGRSGGRRSGRIPGLTRLEGPQHLPELLLAHVPREIPSGKPTPGTVDLTLQTGGQLPLGNPRPG